MPTDYLPADHVTGAWSALWVYGLCGLVLAAHAAFAIHRWIAHARAEAKARRDEARPPQIAPGRAFLCGVVETDDERPAIALTLWEEGREWESKGKWYHRWKERSRAVDVRPFTLRLASGERVRVLPDERVAFTDTLATRLFTGTERERVAELVDGEHACVSGVLLWDRGRRGDGIYRGGAAAPFVLRRGRAEPLVVAVGGLSAGHRRWAAWHRIAALALALVVAALHGGLFFAHHALRAAGEVMPARVTGQHTYMTSNKGNVRTHYVVVGQVERRGGPPFRVEHDVNAFTYREAQARRLVEIPFLVVPALPRVHQVGLTPAVSLTRLVLGALVTATALGLFWWLRGRATPWYEQRRVAQSGKGTLAESVQREEAAARAGRAG